MKRQGQRPLLMKENKGSVMEEAPSRQRMTQPRRNGEDRMQRNSQNWVTYVEKCNAVCRWELVSPRPHTCMMCVFMHRMPPDGYVESHNPAFSS